MSEARSRHRVGLVGAVLRLIQRPWVSVVVLAIMVVDAFTLQPGEPATAWGKATGSTVGTVLGSLRQPYRDESQLQDPPFLYAGWVEREDDIRSITPEEHGFAVAYVITASRETRRTGWWGITRDEHTYWCDLGQTILDDQAALPADLDDRAMELFAASVFEHGDPVWIDKMRKMRAAGTTEHVETFTVWTGYARNALSMGIAVLFLLSLGWIGRPWIVRRGWRRLARGRCAGCGYELGSRAMTSPCPECGVSHRPRVVVAAPRRGVLSRFVQGLQRPVATILLATLLVHDFATLPAYKNKRSGSRIRLWVPFPALRADAGLGQPDENLYIYVKRTPDGDEWSLDYAAWTPQLHDSYFVVNCTSQSRGLWAPVEADAYGHVEWYDNTNPADEDERHRKLISLLEDNGRAALADLLARRQSGIFSYDRALTSGYIHNALAITAALALLVSLGWIPASIARRRSRRREQRGVCGYCLATYGADSATCSICSKPHGADPTWPRSP